MQYGHQAWVEAGVHSPPHEYAAASKYVSIWPESGETSIEM